MLAAIIICEILSTGLIVYGILHEEKLVALEDKIIHWLREKFKETANNIIRSLYLKSRKAKRTYKAVKVGICAKALEKEGITINKK
jgi:hypothetical protein